MDLHLEESDPRIPQPLPPQTQELGSEGQQREAVTAGLVWESCQQEKLFPGAAKLQQKRQGKHQQHGKPGQKPGETPPPFILLVIPLSYA